MKPAWISRDLGYWINITQIEEQRKLAAETLETTLINTPRAEGFQEKKNALYYLVLKPRQLFESPPAW